MFLAAARNQLRIIEIIAGIHAYPRRQAAAHGDFLFLVQQRNFYSVDPIGVIRHDCQADIRRLCGVGVPPISLERRIEHVAEPVNDNRLANLLEIRP